jgi:hypothetical protein
VKFVETFYLLIIVCIFRKKIKKGNNLIEILYVGYKIEYFICLIDDFFNNAQPVNRHFVLLPQQQQQQIVQHPSLMFATPNHNFHQSYAGNMPMQQQQQQLMFVSPQPCPQQSWILSSPPSTSIPTFIPSPQTSFHHIQPPLPSPQPSFRGGTGIPQPSFSGGTGAPHPSFSSGTGVPQPSFSGGTAILKRKSHYLEGSDFDQSVRIFQYEIWAYNLYTTHFFLVEL